MKKTLVLLVSAALLSVNAFASDAYTEREGIVKKYRSANTKPIEIGYYLGSAQREELFYWSQKHLPFANYLSEKTGSLVTLVPEQNVPVFKNLIKAQRYQWIFVNPDMAVLAEEIAYTPVVKQSSNIESILLVRADSSLHKYSDLANKRLGLVKSSITGTYALYKLRETKTTPILIDAGSAGQNSLVSKLDSRDVDAVAIRRDLAEAAMAKNPNKYRVAASAGFAPGFLLLAHTSVSQDEIERVRAAYLGLHAEDSSARHIMSLTGDTLKEGAYFSDWDRDFLKDVRKAMAIIEPDYGRYVYDPASGVYTESYKLFTASPDAPTSAMQASSTPVTTPPTVESELPLKKVASGSAAKDKDAPKKDATHKSSEKKTVADSDKSARKKGNSK